MARNKREIGALQELGCAVAVGRKARRADAHLELERDRRVVECAAQAIDDRRRLPCRGLAVDVFGDDQELVGADMRDARAGAPVRREPPRHLGEHFVAGRMTERADDALELMDLDQADGHRAMGGARLDQDVVEDGADRARVGSPVSASWFA